MAKTPDHSVSKCYYRPLLCVDDWYGPHLEYRSFILPVSRVHGAALDEPDSQMFCGRPVHAMIDLPLIANWYKICTSRHIDPADGHGCCPHTHESVQGLRVIDVQQRCVVRTNGKVDYAALSYVWGNAKRLVLTKDNESWLTTPGAFSQTEENIPKTFRDALEVAAALGIANLWVDAVCIDQTRPDQVKSHMDAMDTIYGSAVLTIVATAKDASSGLPGISLPRGPPQAMFQFNGTRYLSSKATFVAALLNCPWERRAWCLQEKLLSARLLVFTDTQVFYHCSAVTWFEDTIMETSESNTSSVSMAERSVRDKEDQMNPSPEHTVYDTRYTALKDRNFWLLVEDYSQREMTFEADVIRAFGGILKSVEEEHGFAIWGIPQYQFLRGLSWYHQWPRMNSRRRGFPSWSWVGWRTSGNRLYFADCKKNDNNTRVMDGRYRDARGKRNGRSVWDLRWYYYTKDEHNDQMQLKEVQLERVSCKEGPDVSSPVSPAVSRNEPELSRRAKRKYKHLHEWNLPSHPGSKKPAHELMPSLAPGPKMPPLSHVIRFYTSVATVLVHFDGTHPDTHADLCLLRVPGTEIMITPVYPDPQWSGIGKTHNLVYISRSCRDYDTYEDGNYQYPEMLHLLLIESVPGWGEVKRRVQLVKDISILDWRKAKPRWELVSLA
jgi:hypothetical protein